MTRKIGDFVKYGHRNNRSKSKSSSRSRGRRGYAIKIKIKIKLERLFLGTREIILQVIVVVEIVREAVQSQDPGQKVCMKVNSQKKLVRS